MRNVSIDSFKDYFKSSQSVAVGDDFCIMNIMASEKVMAFEHPCRFDCYMIVYCVKGAVNLNINLGEHELKAGMLFFNQPGNIMRINECMGEAGEDYHYVCVLFSKEFMRDLMLDVNRIFTRNFSFVEHPCIELDTHQDEQLHKHADLMISLARNKTPFLVECVRSILSSVFYYMAGVWAEKAPSVDPASAKPTSKSSALVDNFLKLLQEYHTMHRNVGFYAGKLCLTPKYLSRVIRDATGKSAPEWIDSYVILEAKNLLKHSGLAIKEIVFQLNFPNQSVFYKFFKSRTGMTPTEYRNS